MTKAQIFLDDAFRRYHSVQYLYSDPLEYVLKFSDPLDQEVVGLFAAMMAYGNVKQIRKSIERWLVAIGECPREWILRPHHERNGVWKGFVHRFNPESDWITLTALAARSIETHGSLGSHLSSIAKMKGVDLIGAFDSLITEWIESIDPMSPSLKHLFSHPSNGGTCKRWMMFFRWMVRKDELDPGTWSQYFQPNELVMPLDTHTGRLSRKMRLTKRKTLNWETALDVTRKLKTFDPVDPIRYDFSLCRIGMFQKS